MKLIIENINKTKFKKNSLNNLYQYFKYEHLQIGEDLIILHLDKNEILNKTSLFILELYNDIIIYEYLTKFYDNLNFGLKANFIQQVHKNLEKEKWKTFIDKEISEFVKEQDTIYLDGFIRFRLKDYIRKLYEHTEDKIDSYLISLNYFKIIEPIRELIKVQNSRIETLIIELDQEGYKLYDENKILLEKELTDNLIKKFANFTDLNMELISQLINIAPKNIILKLKNDKLDICKTIVKTIKKIFDEVEIIYD